MDNLWILDHDYFHLSGIGGKSLTFTFEIFLFPQAVSDIKAEGNYITVLNDVFFSFQAQAAG